jgi:hypothetical protein
MQTAKTSTGLGTAVKDVLAHKGECESSSVLVSACSSGYQRLPCCHLGVLRTACCMPQKGHVPSRPKYGAPWYRIVCPVGLSAFSSADENK